MVAVTALLRAKKGSEAALERILRELSESVREQEPDCLLYRAARSQHDPQLYVVLERYADEAALAAHANSEHYRSAISELMESLEDMPEIALFNEIEDA